MLKFILSVRNFAALDPAGPLFETGIPLRTMKSTDADFVDVYHTGSGGLGMLRDTGKLDFWVNNGGPIQPGCLPDLGGKSCADADARCYWEHFVP